MKSKVYDEYSRRALDVEKHLKSQITHQVSKEEAVFVEQSERLANIQPEMKEVELKYPINREFGS